MRAHFSLRYRQSGGNGFRRPFRLRNFEQYARFYIVNVTVDCDAIRNQRVLPNSLHIIAHALLLVEDGKPLDEFSCPRSGAFPNILKSFPKCDFLLLCRFPLFRDACFSHVQMGEAGRGQSDPAVKISMC